MIKLFIHPMNCNSLSYLTISGSGQKQVEDKVISNCQLVRRGNSMIFLAVLFPSNWLRPWPDEWREMARRDCSKSLNRNRTNKIIVVRLFPELKQKSEDCWWCDVMWCCEDNPVVRGGCQYFPDTSWQSTCRGTTSLIWDIGQTESDWLAV